MVPGSASAPQSVRTSFSALERSNPSLWQSRMPNTLFLGGPKITEILLRALFETYTTGIQEKLVGQTWEGVA
jgi:hypothetical protein